MSNYFHNEELDNIKVGLSKKTVEALDSIIDTHKVSKQDQLRVYQFYMKLKKQFWQLLLQVIVLIGLIVLVFCWNSIFQTENKKNTPNSSNKEQLVNDCTSKNNEDTLTQTSLIASDTLRNNAVSSNDSQSVDKNISETTLPNLRTPVLVVLIVILVLLVAKNWNSFCILREKKYKERIKSYMKVDNDFVEVIECIEKKLSEIKTLQDEKKQKAIDEIKKAIKSINPSKL